MCSSECLPIGNPRPQCALEEDTPTCSHALSYSRDPGYMALVGGKKSTRKVDHCVLPPWLSLLQCVKEPERPHMGLGEKWPQKSLGPTPRPSVSGLFRHLVSSQGLHRALLYAPTPTPMLLRIIAPIRVC